MPLIQVSLRKGRSPAALRQLAQSLTDAASTALDVPRGSIRVLLSEVPAEHWFVGGEPLGAPTDALIRGRPDGTD
jgi:4-oxalocrotonate tautomerase